jgi:hypothetical protein
MLFTTPAYNQAPNVVKNEQKHLWELQSSTTMAFHTYWGCFEAGKRIYEATQKVATLTFRGMCLCESTEKMTCAAQKNELRPPEISTGLVNPNVGQPTTGYEIIPTK